MFVFLFHFLFFSFQFYSSSSFNFGEAWVGKVGMSKGRSTVESKYDINEITDICCSNMV